MTRINRRTHQRSNATPQIDLDQRAPSRHVKAYIDQLAIEITPAIRRAPRYAYAEVQRERLMVPDHSHVKDVAIVGSDATAGFRELAIKAGFRERSVQTLQESTLTYRADREAKGYLKGAALTLEPTGTARSTRTRSIGKDRPSIGLSTDSRMSISCFGFA